jgi:hypothetical protein
MQLEIDIGRGAARELGGPMTHHPQGEIRDKALGRGFARGETATDR